MSYQEDYREPYKSRCACGKGFLRYYKVYLSNDWFYEKEEYTKVELICNDCKEKYYYQDGYLVPKNLILPKLPERYSDEGFTYEEKIVREYDKDTIKNMIEDMTAKGHIYVKHLKNKTAITFANLWIRKYKKKSLKPMIECLQNILNKYDDLYENYIQKEERNDRKNTEYNNILMSRESILRKSFKLEFKLDEEQIKFEKEQLEIEKERHMYDDFQATVCYDRTYRKDLTNYYWDTYLIKECTDNQYLSLYKPEYGTPRITIEKKYLCECSLCGKKAEILSSNFQILNNENKGYYLKFNCDCHDVSSFEAKTMDILNKLGVTYIREMTFDDLIGNYGIPLRFDFALYKEYRGKENSKIELLLELQGPHHYKKGYYDKYGDFIVDDLNSNLYDNINRYDERKKQYCINNKINLEYIKYTKANSYEKLKDEIIKVLKKYDYQIYN